MNQPPEQYVDPEEAARFLKTLVVGPVRELPTKREALARIQTLRHNINNAALPSGLITVDALYRHYCETELLADNRTAKTRETYRIYLRKWILPRWESDYLHNIKPIAVEQWLRSLPLANGSKSKIRNIMSGMFSHACRYEMADRNPISDVRQSGKRQKVPIILEGTASAVRRVGTAGTGNDHL